MFASNLPVRTLGWIGVLAIVGLGAQAARADGFGFSFGYSSRPSYCYSPPVVVTRPVYVPVYTPQVVYSEPYYPPVYTPVYVPPPPPVYYPTTYYPTATRYYGGPSVSIGGFWGDGPRHVSRTVYHTQRIQRVYSVPSYGHGISHRPVRYRY
jgi:hypothetical protein